MGNLLNLFIAILVVGWLIGFLAFNAGSLIHLLLVIAVIVLLLKIIAGKG
ncbi:MAG TPA: lmo0937 family membrane protein [Saprospiraceae bacterium]|nr:lmo0937 family membrane protein [Saprospiraceae bacterium]